MRSSEGCWANGGGTAGHQPRRRIPSTSLPAEQEVGAAAILGGSANMSSGLPSLAMVDCRRPPATGWTAMEDRTSRRAAPAPGWTAGRGRPSLRSRAPWRWRAARRRGSRLDAFHANIFWYLLDERVLGLDQDLIMRRLVELVERGRHRQAADELGDEPELDQVLGLRVSQEQRDVLAVVRDFRTSAPKPMPVFAVRGSMILSRPSNAPPQMNRMFGGRPARTPGSDACGRPAAAPTRWCPDDLQQRLLHALARHVARDRTGCRDLRRDLVDLVDVDDAPLRLLDVVVARPAAASG